jgi:hypothetical protein
MMSVSDLKVEIVSGSISIVFWVSAVTVLFFLLHSMAFAQKKMEGREAVARETVAWEWVQKKQALLIDVRTPGEFNQGHLRRQLTFNRISAVFVN